jgi:predicted NBD/HSP70 family sugar kinase
MAITALAEPARTARTASKALGNARRVGELAVAAAAVIDQRIRQLGAAIGNPAALAAPEFTLMVSEKVKAAALSGRAMQRRLPAALQAFLVWLERQAAARVGQRWRCGRPARPMTCSGSGRAPSLPALRLRPCWLPS